MSEQADDPARGYAVAFNTLTWDLLGRGDRSRDEDLKMLHAAHASLLHWLEAGTAAHHQRGLWLIARVYAELGSAQEAMRHAESCAALTERARGEMEPFDIAYSLEALARAHAVAGDAAAAAPLRAQAIAAAEALPDGPTRKLTLDDIMGGNWGALGAG